MSTTIERQQTPRRRSRRDLWVVVIAAIAAIAAIIAVAVVITGR